MISLKNLCDYFQISLTVIYHEIRYQTSSKMSLVQSHTVEMTTKCSILLDYFNYADYLFIVCLGLKHRHHDADALVEYMYGSTILMYIKWYPCTCITTDFLPSRLIIEEIFEFNAVVPLPKRLVSVSCRCNNITALPIVTLGPYWQTN